MRLKAFLVGVLALILASTALAYTPTQLINFQNCSDPQRLEKLLNDQFAAIRDDLGSVILQGTGNFFYVDSGAGSDTYTGLDWIHPKATLDAAVALCTANNGDVIFVAAGHNEALTAADGVDLDVAGITVVGLGNGYDRPRFDYDHADGEFVIGAASVAVYNLQFLPSVTVVTHAIDIENAGDYALISGCEFLDGEATATDEFVDTIQVGTTATNVTIQNCRYTSITSVQVNNFVDLSAATIASPTIQGNVIYGAFLEAGIWAGAAVPTNCLIKDNIVTNLDTGQYAIEFQGNATGLCIGNQMVSDDYATMLDPGSMKCIGNVGQDSIDVSSITLPQFVRDTPHNYIGDDETDNAATTSAVQPNRDGSILERLEFLIKYFETGTAGGLVAPADTRSILDILGSDGTTTTDALAGSILGAIGTNEATAATPFASNTVAADNDGSVLERLEALAIAAQGSDKHPNYLLVSTGTFDTTGTWSTAASHEIATVTGVVKMTIIPVFVTNVSSVSDTGTIALGDETTGNSIIAASTLGAGVAVADELWTDATLTRTILTQTQINATTIVVSNKDIGYTVATNALSAGSMAFHIFWTPLSAGATVVAGAGGTL